MGAAPSFIHLHVKSGFSWGFGTATPEELVEAAASMGMSSLSITDKDSLYGVPRFLKAADELGVGAIVGAEISMAEGGHLVLLIENEEGYRNLCRLITAYRCSSEDRRRPCCPLDLICEHADGIVCLTGAIPFGHLPHLLLSAQQEKARRTSNRLREAFEGRLFVELTNDLTAGSSRRIREVFRFASENGLPVVVTNEVAYLQQEDYRLHDVLVASSNLSALPGPGYRPTDQLYLKSQERMQKLFRGHQEALKSTEIISERCSKAVRLTGEIRMPTVRLPREETPEQRLVRLVVAGARKRYGKKASGEVKRTLRRELSCIFSLGFASYFLLAKEAVQIAHNKEIPVTGRGSAANSMVAYCLGLTQPEPLSNRLLFERFLHEGREDPPDIDLDFDSERRDEVREEMIGRYRHLGVAEAATSQTFSLRGAVRVAAKALGHTPQEINALSWHVPTRFRDRGLTYNPTSGLREVLCEPAMKSHPLQDTEKYALLLDLSWRLSGKLHQAGTHSGGMVFGSALRHLSEMVPLEPSGMEGLLRVQADKDDLELLGLPKLDLLGLRMHTALRKAGELASKRIGEKMDSLSPLPGDKDTYDLIKTGRNVGMFQLESPGQMHLSCRLKPRRFEDLVAQISLFRPGPVRGDLVTPYVMRKNGLEPYSAILPELEEVLKPTYGVLVYQEQVLAVANAVAGFSLAEGDALRRAMTKSRGPGAMDEIRREFLYRARKRGVPEGKAEEIFNWMEGFSVYGFPKAHAASFASVSYASAYMRTHYPAEFFAGVLNSQPMGFFSPRTVLNEARRSGLEILPPDIHLSGEDFTVEDEGTSLQVGLRYCKGLSDKAISSIISEREKKPFASVADLYQRTSTGKDGLINLVQAGFLEQVRGRRGSRSLLEETKTLPKKRIERGRQQPEIPIHPASWWTSRESRKIEHLPITETEKERLEWSVLGLNVHRHPLKPYQEALRDLGVTSSSSVPRLPHGTRTRVAGLLECLQRPPTKSGRPVYFLLVEDEWGLLQATIFEDVYKRDGHVLHHKGAFLLEGRVEQDRRRGFSFLVERVRDLGEVLAGAEVSSPRAVAASGAFLRAGRRSRRAG